MEQCHCLTNQENFKTGIQSAHATVNEIHSCPAQGTWIEYETPINADILLPASLRGQYRLHFRDRCDAGLPIVWLFSQLGQNVSGSDYGFVNPANHHTTLPMSKVVSHKEPIKCRILRPELKHTDKVAMEEENIKKKYKEKQNGESWKVYHCAEGGRDPHTLLCVEDLLVEIKQLVSVHVETVLPEDWFSLCTHQRATCLKDVSDQFKHCYVAYSDKAPRTHILIGKHSIHIDAAVSLRLTSQAEGFIQNIGFT